MQRGRKISLSRSFSMFLVGQGILNLGESMRFIAVTMLIYNMTGSGITTAAGVALSTITSIFASPFAGVLGDRTREGRLLILIDIARFLTIPLFLYSRSIANIYMILVLISVFDVLYSPSRRKYILDSTGREGALKAHSKLTGIGGAAYLVGPLMAGFLTDSYGSSPVIIIASLCCLISGLMTFCSVITAEGGSCTAWTDRCVSASSGLLYGIRYCRYMPAILELLVLGIIISFCTISVNLAFYPMAFNAIKVTAKGWSLMISIYYGTNFLSMFLTKYLGRKHILHDGRLLYSCLIAVSAIWLVYAYVRNYACILLMQFVEGLLVAVVGIVIAARYQIIIDKNYMGRVTSINDIVSSIGKLFGMGCTVFIIGRFSFGGVFILCSVVLFVFSLGRRLRPEWISAKH